MKKVALFGILILLVTAGSKAQTIKTVGTTGADYSTLKAAFDAINAGTLTGSLELRVIDNTTEAAAAVLNASGSGSASYTAISIYPTVTGKTISGNLAAAMIQLNGADNVTIDGRLNRTGSSVNLTMNNTNTGGSTISLIEGATSNIIQYNTLKSAGLTSALATVFFGTSTISGGNSNNTIAYNSFTGSTTRCMTAIGSVGTAAPNDNVNNTIDNNLFYDMMYFPAYATTSTGFAAIRIGTNSSAWALTNNKFYETSSVAVDMNFSGSIRASFVNINVGASSGSFTISNNYFGGTAADGTGILTKAAGGFSSNYVDFDVIYIKTSNTAGLVSSVQGNTFKNMNMSNCFGGSLNLLNIAGGAVNVGNVTGNLFGSSTQKAAIQLSHGSTCMVDASANAGRLTGIFITADVGTINISNNTIAGFFATQSATQDANASISGIEVNNASVVTGPTVVIENNSIGAAIDSSLEVRSGKSSTIRGIAIATKAIAHIRNNTIQKLYAWNKGNGSTDHGIYVAPSTATAWIRNNVVKNMVSTAVGADRNMTGIDLSANGAVSGNTVFNLTLNVVGGTLMGINSYGQNTTDTGLVYNNFVYNLKADTTTASAVVGITGIYAAAKLKNNVVVLDQNNKLLNVGIYSLGPCVLHNTVYLTGTQTSAGGITTAFYSGHSSSSVPGDFRNNIWVNNRTNAAGGTAKHYAVGMRTPLAGLISDYNVYYAPNTNGVLGFSAFNSANPYSTGDKTTLAAWQAYTLQDCHSYNEDPGFTNPSVTSSVGSYLPTNTGISGYPFIQTYITNYSVATDYYGATRGTQALAPSATGAIEYATTPRAGYTAPFIRKMSRYTWSTGDSASITVSGPGLGLVTTVAGASPAYYFYYIHGLGAAAGNYKVSAVTVLSDTSFRFNVPQIKNFDTAYLMYLNVKMCGSATSGYSYMPSTTESLVLVPVRYAGFSATRKGQQSLLQWSTAQEQDAKDFIVQHSTDALHWNAIAQVKAIGNSQVLQRYTYRHINPSTGINYYRLLQEDIDGNTSLSSITSVLMPATTSLKIYPNPVVNGTLMVRVASATTLKIYNQLGTLYITKVLPAGTHLLQVHSLPKGAYVLKNENESVPFLIQ